MLTNDVPPVGPSRKLSDLFQLRYSTMITCSSRKKRHISSPIMRILKRAEEIIERKRNSKDAHSLLVQEEFERCSLIARSSLLHSNWCSSSSVISNINFEQYLYFILMTLLRVCISINAIKHYVKSIYHTTYEFGILLLYFPTFRLSEDDSKTAYKLRPNLQNETKLSKWKISLMQNVLLLYIFNPKDKIWYFTKCLSYRSSLSGQAQFTICMFEFVLPMHPQFDNFTSLWYVCAGNDTYYVTRTLGQLILIHEPRREKTCLCHMRTTKAQISLRIRVVWSAPLLFAAWIV